MIARVLVNTGSTVRTCGIIYKGLAQSVLLYISDIWVVMGDMLKVLEGFHHDTARRITGNDGDMWGGRGVVIPPGGDGNGRRRNSPHRRVHRNVSGNQSVKGGLPHYL